MKKFFFNLFITAFTLSSVSSCMSNEETKYTANTITVQMFPYQQQSTVTLSSFEASGSNPSGNLQDVYSALSGLVVYATNVPDNEKLSKVTFYNNSETPTFRRDGKIAITSSMSDAGFGNVSGGSLGFTNYISTVLIGPVTGANQTVQILLFPVEIASPDLYLIATTIKPDNTSRAYRIKIKTSGAVAFSKGAINSITADLSEADIESTRFAEIENVGLNNGYGIELFGKIFSPVNCGYDDNHPYGLLYQFSRKDGQGYNTQEGEPQIKASLLDFSTGTPEVDASTFYTSTSPDGETDNWRTPIVYSWQDNDKPFNSDKWQITPKTESAMLASNATNINETETPDNIPGFWVGYNAKNATAEEPIGCLFIPASGARDAAGRANERGEMAALWIDTVDSTTKRPAMTIIKESTRIAMPLCTMGAAVRCTMKY